MNTSLSFNAHVISGAGRGKQLGTPTMNLDLSAVPSGVHEGIYACFCTFDGRHHQAVMHYGPRPVFKDTASCEIHVLDTTINEAPQQLTVEIIHYLREVRDFQTPEALMAQIAADIDDARAILRNT